MEKIKSLLLGALFIIVSTTLQAQSFEATGVVVDNFGDAVIGATVMQKGTSNGTVTDIDGNFKINVNNGDILSVSYIGYVTQEFPAAKDMRIVLKEDAQSLQEVVVTGYQVQRKVDLTGAVAVMDMKGPKSESDPNMLNSM